MQIGLHDLNDADGGLGWQGRIPRRQQILQCFQETESVRGVAAL